MKKVLFGTTALAVAMSAGAAFADGHAAAPELSFSGFYKIGFVGRANDNNGGVAAAETEQFVDDMELQWKIKYPVESLGIEIGHAAEVQMEQNTAMSVDESYIFIDTGFGQFELGEDEGAADTLAVVASFDDQGITGMGSTAGASGDFSTYMGLVSDSAKINYFTPVLGGIVTAGVSYTPNQSNANGANTVTNSILTDIVEFGINANVDLGGVAVAASFGIEEGETKEETAATQTGQYGFGLTASMAGFTVGGSFLETTGDNNFTEVETWQIGAKYEMGALTVGVGFGEQDSGAATNAEKTSFGIGASYSLAESVTLSAGHQIIENDTANSDASATGVALNVKF